MAHSQRNRWDNGARSGVESAFGNRQGPAHQMYLDNVPFSSKRIGLLAPHAINDRTQRTATCIKMWACHNWLLKFSLRPLLVCCGRAWYVLLDAACALPHCNERQVLPSGIYLCHAVYQMACTFGGYSCKLAEPLSSAP